MNTFRGLLIRSARRQIWLLPVTIFLLQLFIGFGREKTLLGPDLITNFTSQAEVLIALIMVPIFAFILTNTQESSLALSCGVRVSSLLWAKFLPRFMYILLPVLTLVFSENFKLYYSPNYYPDITLYLPSSPTVATFCVALSVVITVTFFAALAMFLRLSTKSTLAAFVGSFAAYWMFMILDHYARNHLFTHFLWIYYINPFLSRFILTDHTAITKFHIGPVWTINRLFFGLATIALLWGCHILAKHTTIHEKNRLNP